MSVLDNLVFKLNPKERKYIHNWATKTPLSSTPGKMARFLLWVDRSLQDPIPVSKAAKVLGFTTGRVRAIYKRWSDQGVVSAVHGKRGVYSR